MNDKIFLDTNILVYCYTDTEPEKKAAAQALAQHVDVWISTQVMQELSNTLKKKFAKTWPDILATLEEVCKNFNVFSNQPETILQAIRISEKYGYSFYDSLILSAGIETGCSVLYSEDMQSGQSIEGKLTIKNPLVR